MNITTTKGVRKVTLTAAEKRLLTTARALCQEINELLGDEDAGGAYDKLFAVCQTYDPPKSSETKDKELATK